MSAAMKISRLAVGDRTMAPTQITFAPPPGLAQDRHIEGLPLGTRGGMLIHHMFPLDAEYDFSFGGRGGRAGRGCDLTHFDGQPIKIDNPRSLKLKVSAGPHVIGVALVDRQRGAGVDEIYSDFRTNAAFVRPAASDAGHHRTVQSDRRRRHAEPPQDLRVPSVVRRRRKRRAHERSSRRWRARAYRGPVSAAEVNTLMDFYREGANGADFDAGIQQALARILVAPRFVFRAEEEPADGAPGSRLSHQRRRARLAAVVLPLEQHPRRRAARPRRQGTAARAGRC